MVHVVSHSDQNAQSASSESSELQLQFNVLLEYRLMHHFLDEADHGLVKIVIRLAATCNVPPVFLLEETRNQLLTEFSLLPVFVL